MKTAKELQQEAVKYVETAIGTINANLIGIVKAAGGLVKMFPDGSHEPVKAVPKEGCLMDTVIYALRYDGESLTLLTDNALSNYQWDEGYEFGSIYEFNEEELEVLDRIAERTDYYDIPEEIDIVQTAIRLTEAVGGFLN